MSSAPSMRYTRRPPKRRVPRKFLVIVIVLVSLLLGATFVVRHVYFDKLKPADWSSDTMKLVTIASGASVDEIAAQLKDAGLIRSPWAFKLYVSSKKVRESLEAGTYSLSASQSIGEIVAQLTHGKVATDLVTVLPGQNLAQTRQTLINYGFKADDVDQALNATQYTGHPALVDKPAGADLEGYIYPDSYQATSATLPSEIIANSLTEMDKQLSPELRAAFAQQGLSTYEAITLASIVEKEVPTQKDREQAAQVFLKRLRNDMFLGSDVTAYYGSNRAGKGDVVSYDSPYNTHLYKGLPPTPVGSVSASSLHAVAHPANTDWLFFVTGDDGVTHFTKTLEDHEAAGLQYCHKLCGRP